MKYSSNRDSEYATHILDNRHQNGKIEQVMKRTDFARKVRFMNTGVNFYIYIQKEN
jgi:hypothetical protein